MVPGHLRHHQELDQLFIVCNTLQLSKNSADVRKRGKPRLGRTTTGKKLNPERALARFEFLEAIVRVAKLTFADNNTSMLDAVRCLLTHHVLPTCTAPGLFKRDFRSQEMMCLEVRFSRHRRAALTLAHRRVGCRLTCCFALNLLCSGNCIDPTLGASRCLARSLS